MRAFVTNILKNRLLVGCLSIAGMESLLLLSRPHHVYDDGPLPSAIALTFLAWFWLSVALAARLVIRGLGRVETQRPTLGKSARGVVSGLIVAGALHYVASWAMYFKTGQFANLSTILFAVKNPPATTWLYLGPGERNAIVLAICGALIAWPVCGFVMGRLAQQVRAKKQGRSQIVSWVSLTLILFLLTKALEADRSPTRLGPRKNTLMNCVNPQLTLATTIARRFTLEPIDAVLDKNELQRLTTWTGPTADKDRPSVVFIAIEALRSDVVGLTHQGREVTPNLNRLARNGLNWTKAYSQSTHSDYADVCIVSSLYPLRTREHHYYRRRDPWPKTLAFDVFKQAGYRTAIISSQNEAWGCMDQFLETPNLDLFYDAQRSGAETYISEKDRQFQYENDVGTFSAGCLYDPHTMSKAVSWMAERFEADEPFFISMNFQASHFPYELPEGTERPFQPCEITSDISFLEYPKEKTHIVRNAYYNGLAHCDDQLGRMIESLELAGRLDDTILVIMGENGEAFHESGTVGHARDPVEPAIHVATVMHAPKYFPPGEEDYPLELVDLLPTVLGKLDWPTHPNFQGTDALSSTRVPLHDRLLFFHANSPAANSDAVQWAGRWKFIQDHRTGRGFLRDIATNPEETHEFSSEQPAIAAQLRELLAKWRARQLAYYHYPMYYENFYPPKAPGLSGRIDAVSEKNCWDWRANHAGQQRPMK